jgi:hypothetical protein
MRRRRYQVRDELVISATPERIFDVATDASLVPLYADEIHSIDVLERNDRNASVRSVLKVAGMRIPFRYRYHYRRPTARGRLGSRMPRASRAESRGSPGCAESSTSASSAVEISARSFNGLPHWRRRAVDL